MVKYIVIVAVITGMAVPSAGGISTSLSPTTVFEGSTTLKKDGAAQAVHVSIQAWRITGQEQDIPLHDFYIAHLLSGQIATTINGQRTGHLAGDYWIVKPNELMQVKVIGEVAVLETTVVTKE